MNFGFGEEQEAVREAVRKFLESESPIAKVRAQFDDPLGFDRDTWRRGAELGLYGLLIPEQYGGGGVTSQPLIDLFVVAEEMGRMLQPGPFLPTHVVGWAVSEFGSDAQREEILPAISSGEKLATWCLCEPKGEWNAGSVTLEARAAGDGFVLDGVKTYVQDALAADHLLITARVQGGLTQFLIPSGSAGVKISPLTAFDPTRRLASVSFDGVRVPASAVVGPVGGAETAVERQLEIAVVLLCAESLGAQQFQLEETVQYAKVRVAFGRPIGSFQALKHRIADLYMLLESSRAVAYYAALAVQERLPDVAEAVAIAKSYVGEASTRMSHETIQLHGGIAFTWEHDAHLFLKRAKSNEVLYGAPHAHRERLYRLLDASPR